METPSTDGGVEPESSQPWMFGGHLAQVRLPWTWARKRLREARNYWIATTRPDGKPHSRPVWGTWLDDALYFSTGSLAAQNLATNPEITVHLESGSEVVIIEDVAEPVSDTSIVERVVSLYNQKYHWDLDAHNLPGPFMLFSPMSRSVGSLMRRDSIKDRPSTERRHAGDFRGLRHIPPHKEARARHGA